MTLEDFKKGCEQWTRDEILESLYEITKQNNKAIDNLENSIKAINKKLENDKELKVENGIIINMNVYQKVRLKAFKTKCKELLNILKGEK